MTRRMTRHTAKRKAGTGDGGSSMDMACGTCRTCGKLFARLVRMGTAGKAQAALHCSDECRDAAKARDGAAAAVHAKRKAARGARRGNARHGTGASTRAGNRMEPSNAELRRQLRAESTAHRRRMRADPRLIVHCHWCMDEASERLLDPAWRRTGRKGRAILLCRRCARHVKVFMRDRGYDMVRTTNERAAEIMEDVAAPATVSGAPASAKGRRRRR